MTEEMNNLNERVFAKDRPTIRSRTFGKKALEGTHDIVVRQSLGVGHQSHELDEMQLTTRIDVARPEHRPGLRLALGQTQTP